MSLHVFSTYNVGLERLLSLVKGQPHYEHALALQARLFENTSFTSSFGDNETRRTDRAVILEQLNQLALIVTNDSFLALCTVATSDISAEVPLLATPITPDINPFEYGLPVRSTSFYGRQSQRQDIKNRIGSVSAQCISIVGLRRNGKTSMLHYIKENPYKFCQEHQRPLIVLLDLQSAKFATPSGIIEGLRRAIEKDSPGSAWQSQQNDDPFAVDDGLEQLRDSGRRLIILIDEFERIAAHIDRFQDWGADWRSKANAGYFSLVIATNRPIIEIYDMCGLTSPFGNIFTDTILGAFSTQEWHQLVRDGFEKAGINTSNEDIALIDELAGGLPFYTQMAAALLFYHRDHRATRAAFITQATDRFNELWHDLNTGEQYTLRQLVNNRHKTVNDDGVYGILKRHGLLRQDGHLFSSAFTDFVLKRS